MRTNGRNARSKHPYDSDPFLTARMKKKMRGNNKDLARKKDRHREETNVAQFAEEKRHICPFVCPEIFVSKPRCVVRKKCSVLVRET